jgi:hypothetical protein
MATNNKTLMYVGGAGILGLLIYEWWKGNQATAVTTTTTTTLATSSAPAAGSAAVEIPQTVPNSGVSSPMTILLPNPAAAAAVPPNGIDVNTYTVVQKWGISDGRAPVLAMLAAAVPSEYAGMYDIIVNAWGANKPVTQAQTQFWDNLRNKYDPQHLSW